MLIYCKSCKNKITISENVSPIDGKLITCNICKEEWIHHSTTFFLESRLVELEQDLNREESLILEENLKYSERITLLEKELTKNEYELLKPHLGGVYLIDNKPQGSSIQKQPIKELFNQFNKQHVLTH